MAGRDWLIVGAILTGIALALVLGYLWLATDEGECNPYDRGSECYVPPTLAQLDFPASELYQGDPNEVYRLTYQVTDQDGLELAGSHEWNWDGARSGRREFQVSEVTTGGVWKKTSVEQDAMWWSAEELLVTWVGDLGADRLRRSANDTWTYVFNGTLVAHDSVLWQVDLTLTSARGPVTFAEHGISSFGTYGTLTRYAFTDLEVSGTMTSFDEVHVVSGRAILEHRWGSVRGEDRQQFGFALADGRFLDILIANDIDTGVPIAAYVALVAVDGNVSDPFADQEWVLTATSFLETTPGVTLGFGDAWTIHAGDDTQLTITPLIRGQSSVAFGFQNARISGTLLGQEISGAGFEEDHHSSVTTMVAIPTALRISVELPVDPLGAKLRLGTSTNITSAEVHYRVERDGAWFTSWATLNLTPDGNGSWVGEVPGQPLRSTVWYAYSAADAGGTYTRGEVIPARIELFPGSGDT